MIKNMWNEWVIEYEKQLEDYYLSDKEEEKLEVYKETKQYIEKNKHILAEQLLRAEVTDVKYIDVNTYEITSEEVYDIQQTKDYDTEIKDDTTDEMQTVCHILFIRLM